MEIMTLPSKEILIYCDEITPHIKSVVIGKIPKIIFKENTPQELIDRFLSIKDKIGRELDVMWNNIICRKRWGLWKKLK